MPNLRASQRIFPNLGKIAKKSSKVWKKEAPIFQGLEKEELGEDFLERGEVFGEVVGMCGA